MRSSLIPSFPTTERVTTFMAPKNICLGCGGQRDRGPYTKYCSSCFVKPCRRCGNPNLRGPKTVLCETCKELPPVDSAKVCRRCGQDNDRGGRTRICSTCLDADAVQTKRANTKMMNEEAKPGLKWCPECEEYKPYESFYTSSRKAGDQCKSCSSKTNRDGRLKSKFNMTEKDYEVIFDHQGGMCAICGNKPKARKFHVDHDHTSGLVRGILCLWCNHKVLGGARDNIDILKAAIEYLENPPAVQAVGEIFGNTGPTNKKDKKNYVT